MTEYPYVVPPNYDEAPSLFALGSFLLRYRRTIATFAIIGAVLGVLAALSAPRVYRVSATFLPGATEQGTSDLAFAASRLGVNLPSSGSGWAPPVYAQLLRSRTLQEPILLDTIVIGSGRHAVMDLLGIPEAPPHKRLELGLKALSTKVSAYDLKDLRAVQLSVTTHSPTISFAIAEQLIAGVERFNMETRKSQATAERHFVERQAADAERALRAAEDRLQNFLIHNRSFQNSPQLNFERDRLQREVALRQQVYTSLVQSREEAKIRQIRDTPVLTILNAPHLPSVAEPRKRVMKVVVGGLAGILIGIFAAFIRNSLTTARSQQVKEADEFFRLVNEAKPKFRNTRVR